MSGADEQANGRGDWYAVCIALVYPTLLTVVYFILLAKHSTTLQQGTYAIGKFIQFTFPAVWVVGIERKRIGWSRPRRSDLVWGSSLGLGLLAVALALYHFAIKPMGFSADAQ